MGRVKYRAYVHRDAMNDPLMMSARLIVIQDRVGSPPAVLCEDNTWHELREGELPPVAAGLAFPLEAIDAIGRGIEEYQGKTNHGATETKVLREWLAVEQRRVDEALGR